MTRITRDSDDVVDETCALLDLLAVQGERVGVLSKAIVVKVKDPQFVLLALSTIEKNNIKTKRKTENKKKETNQRLCVGLKETVALVRAVAVGAARRTAAKLVHAEPAEVVATQAARHVHAAVVLDDRRLAARTRPGDRGDEQRRHALAAAADAPLPVGEHAAARRSMRLVLAAKAKRLRKQS